MPTMKIIVCNLKHGSNLGDRLIAECLEAELRSAAPNLDIVTVDLAGRDQPSVVGQKRLLTFFVLDLLPRRLRAVVAEAMLRNLARTRLRPKWRPLLSTVQAVVVGGGGIFADHDLNFPVKINAFLDEAERAGLPVAIFAVGVARGWSRKGQDLLGRALSSSRLIHVSVRDLDSQENWRNQLRRFTVKEASLAPDPALLTAKYFPRRPKQTKAVVVGLCITSEAALRYHGTEELMPTRLEAWYTDVAHELGKRGYHVAIFTTGVPEDVAFAAKLALSSNGADNIILTAPFTYAAEMVELIGDCDLIIAHRLHAIIAAYSYGIPALALDWDAKMRSICTQMGYADRLLDASKVSAAEIADRVQGVLDQGIDAANRAKLVAAAEHSVSDLAMALRSLSPSDAG
jgi:polysaccharide pyruvyl transferase WcaK-like protein